MSRRPGSTSPCRHPDTDTVDAFYAAALGAGGEDNGEPGLRTHYHPGYYGAYVLDPDGNNVEAVNHGLGFRSCRATR